MGSDTVLDIGAMHGVSIELSEPGVATPGSDIYFHRNPLLDERGEEVKTMPGLTLYSGNRLETLTDKFAEIVSASPLHVMTKESIVLQSMGMMKWLTVEMSRRLGVWSNYEYVFPNRMAGNILSCFIPDRGDERFFDKDMMTWKCMELVLREKENKNFAGLSAYIDNDRTGVKLFQISSRIIDLFDQYMTFRPEMIIDWDKGGMAGEWQAEFWRILTADMSGEHPPALLYKVYDIINGDGKFIPVNLPPRITVFGISYIPMYHMNILRAASYYSEVNLFILNPSPEYWGNILTEKEKRKIISSSPILPGEPEEYLHLERGNTLLASLGRVGRDFLHNIFMADLDTHELFEKPERKSLLTMIQDDIYAMRDGSPESGKHNFSEEEISNDNSVIINSCHSSMREVEVLHDYILDLLNSDETLAPGEILVMSPDIEEYSGSIHGIFSRDGSGVPRIPFRIVDRKLRNTSSVVDTFFRILSLESERFTSASVLGIVQCEEVRERFGLGSEDMDRVGRWVRETEIYWGLDSVYREELGLPGIHENTWRFGLDRMLLGGMMNCDEKISLGILPYSGIEGSDLRILGRFISFYNSLREIYYMLKKDYTAAEWRNVIDFIIDSLFAGDGVPAELGSVSAAALKLGNDKEPVFAEKLGVNVITEYLDRALSEAASGMDFVSGSLTFCEMLPMRSIPCRVICILGMNDSAFPRKSRGLSFDLTSASPRRGDRSVRDEDRYLFLETLISAREKLYISYTGQSMSSGGSLNPSVVVNELLEYIDEFYGTGSGSITGHIFKTHRIQPYNPLYFISGSGLYTYQESKIDGARSFALGEKSDYRFMKEFLPPLADDEKTLGIDELVSFIINPSRALMNRRLGLFLGLKSGEYIEEEPFTPDFLDRYRLNSGIMDALQRGMDRDTHFNLVRASGALPHGTPGVLTYDSSFRQVKTFYDRFSSLLINKEDKTDIELNIDKFTLTGTADNIYGGRNIFFRYASVKGRDIIHAWVMHLALCASGKFSGDTVLISKSGNKGWNFLPGSGRILSELLALYEEGMTGPLPLFPESSLKFAETFFDGKKGDPGARALRAAAGAFSNGYSGGDSDDPYIGKLFGDFFSCADRFRKATLKVYSPVFENMTEVVEL